MLKITHIKSCQGTAWSLVLHLTASVSSHHTTPFHKRTKVPSQGTISWFNPYRNAKYRFVFKFLTQKCLLELCGDLKGKSKRNQQSQKQVIHCKLKNDSPIIPDKVEE